MDPMKVCSRPVTSEKDTQIGRPFHGPSGNGIHLAGFCFDDRQGCSPFQRVVGLRIPRTVSEVYKAKAIQIKPKLAA